MPKYIYLSPLAKLAPKQVRRMLTLRKKGWGQVKLAEHFGVSQSAISHILNNRTYRSIVTHE